MHFRIIADGKSQDFDLRIAVVGVSNCDARFDEVASEGIRVNSVSPGVIETDMVYPAARELGMHSPLGRLGRPEEIAATVSWLVSPAASFVTGSDVAVTGGF